MQLSDQPVLRDIVLVGGGHSHAVLLRRWAMRPMPGVRLTLICRDTHTPYSGMLPGYVAGLYRFDQVHIDLRTLAQAAGARFFRAEVTGLDLPNRQVICQGRPPIPYDRLSINIGATPGLGVPGAQAHAVPVKPIHLFNQHWLDLLERVRARPGRMRLAVVGAGAGGVELLLSMQARLHRELRQLGRDTAQLQFDLYSSTPQILPTHNARVRRYFLRLLEQRGVGVHVGQAVTHVWAGCLQTASGQVFDADEVVWVTQATGAPWLRSTGLALDEAGFIVVNANLQSVSDDRVFAAGDIASLRDCSVEKAGVFAVRQGPILHDNLRRSLQAQPLRPYRPQRRWLALIGTGDRHAVASRGLFFAAGSWVWRWKDAIDRRFMTRFSDLAPQMAGSEAPHVELPLESQEQAQVLAAQAMRCGGCGAKVSASVLARVLARLPAMPGAQADVLLGRGDDAAVLRVPAGMALVQSLDFFRAFIDDPYVFGRIAANHALGDLFAMGAQPHSALALATVPPGLPSQVEDLLVQMLSGGLKTLEGASCVLVGGHTAEGRELGLGFSVNGWVPESLQGLMTKGGLQPGDLLVLTKPVGTGVLLVAHQHLRARGEWIDAALETMMSSNRKASEIFRAHGVRSCTDVTGFGLVGHLLEMTRPSGVDAELHLSALPVLEGALASAAAGHLSSLHAANAQFMKALRSVPAGQAVLPLLFDPQTAGGLLAGVPAAQADACLAALRDAGYGQAAVIGKVMPRSQEPAPLCLKG